jgi:hypothetical protein
MFYQNSNDLVKNATIRSGHVQNSNETRQLITSQVSYESNRIGSNTMKDNNNNNNNHFDNFAPEMASSSLSFGSQFQNNIQGLFTTMKEGMSEQEKLNMVAEDSEKNEEIQKAHIKKVSDIMALINKDDTMTRNSWVELIDTDGFSVYGYVGHNGIFQIWNIPNKGNTTSWVDTKQVNNNADMFNCPSRDKFKKINIAGKFGEYKMYDLVYQDTDNAKTNPLFLITSDIRNNSYNNSGIFSCGNEGQNVYVTERPSAEVLKSECYTLNDAANLNDNDLNSRQLYVQHDLTTATIGQCKRRTEDLGGSHFIMFPNGNTNNSMCIVYTGTGEPNLNGLLTPGTNQTYCHADTNPDQSSEDNLLKKRSTTEIPRLYGKTTREVVEPLPRPDCNHRDTNRCIFKGYNYNSNGTCIPLTNSKPKADTTGGSGFIKANSCRKWAMSGACDAPKDKAFMMEHCQTSCAKAKSRTWKNAVRMSENPNFSYSYKGLSGYSNDQLKGWLISLFQRDGGGVERKAVRNYIERCKGTKGYTFLDDNYTPKYKTTYGVPLYSLKTEGLNSVNKGEVGKLAYIDHNGERHEYPDSALLYKKTTFETTPKPDPSKGPNNECPQGWWKYNSPTGPVCYPGCENNRQWRHPDGTCMCNRGGDNQKCPAGFKCLSNKCQRGVTTAQKGQYIKLPGYDTRAVGNSYDIKNVPSSNEFPRLGNIPNWKLQINFMLYPISMTKREVRPNPDQNGNCGWGWWAEAGKCFQQCAYNEQRRNADGKCLHNGSWPNDKCGPQQFEPLNGVCERTQRRWSPLIGDMYNSINVRGWGLWVSPDNKIHWSWKNEAIGTEITVNTGIIYIITVEKSPEKIVITLINDTTKEKQTFSSSSVKKEMATNGPVWIGGWENNTNEIFPGIIYSVTVTGLYSVSNLMIQSKAPPSIGDVSIEECSEMCDSYEECGGYVYKDGLFGANGKCELKDRNWMYPKGIRIVDKSKDLYLKAPMINNRIIKDLTCSTAKSSVPDTLGNKSDYIAINTAQYLHYPNKGNMTSDFKCNMKDLVPMKDLKPLDFSLVTDSVNSAITSTKTQTNIYKQQMTVTPPQPPSSAPVKEGFQQESYATTISGVGETLRSIANSKYQRERLLAITEESNKNLISESYKFILWSILAILTVLALLKLKEMFGQEDASDSGGGDDGSGGGLLATILGWFGVGSIKTDDIPDRTEEVKAALSSAGNQLKETGEQLANSVTEGADNLVKSANEAAAGAVEGATNLVDKAKETASNAIDRIGTATSAATGAAAPPPSTGGKLRHTTKNSRKK